MKNLPIYFFILIFSSLSTALIAQDDVYYDPSDDQVAPASFESYDVAEEASYDDYVAYEGTEERIANNFDSDFDFCYAARIKRFNRSYQGFNYYDPCYTDANYYGSGNANNNYYYNANSANGFWTIDRNNRWVYILNGNQYGNINTNNYNPFNSYTTTTYGYGNYGYTNTYNGYGNTYNGGYGSTAYDPYCNGYSTASPYSGSGTFNTTPNNTTTIVRPTRGNNVPGTPTTTTPTRPRAGNGQTITTTNTPKPSIGKTRTVVKPTITKNKAKYTKPTRDATKYTKPTRSTTKPSRATTPRYNKPTRSSTPSYSKPSRSSSPSYSPSRSGGSSGGSKSSPSRGGMRGGK